jgi:hypothetical protein
VATSLGSFIKSSTVESALSAALQLRGAEVHAFLCDSALPACMSCTVGRIGGAVEMADHGPKRDFCPGCFAAGAKVYEGLGVVVHRYGDFLSGQDRAEAAEVARSTPWDAIRSLEDRGIPVGDHALSGALRFFARATLDGEPEGEAVLRRYLEAAILTARATTALMTTIPFECAVFHHGIYVPQGVIGAVARQLGVRVVNWATAYRANSFLFSHGDTYHHTLRDEPVDEWEDIAWNAELDAELTTYLRSRWNGSQDWISFHTRAVEDGAAILAELGVDPSKPCVGLLTNVMWDAQLHYRANAFPNMLEWCLQTVSYFAARPDLQLIIRVHPAELTGRFPSRQPIIEELHKAFPEMPPNVFVIGPESDYSTYATMLQCDTVLIYGTKTGVELTAIGVPVIVAGEAWIRNKGLTLDASSPEEYCSLLDRIPFGESIDEATQARAKKYAFHFFFRRMIPVEFVERVSGPHLFRLDVASLDELMPGRSIGLDIICDGILEGAPFVYPAELELSGQLES